MEISKKTSNIIVILFIVVLLLISYLRGCHNTKTIKEDTKIENGLIFNYHLEYGGFKRIKYEFNYNNKHFENDELLNGDWVNASSLVNKWFPVVFSVKSPENNEMLITPDDFAKYNIPFPDSLEWVKQYVK